MSRAMYSHPNQNLRFYLHEAYLPPMGQTSTAPRVPAEGTRVEPTDFQLSTEVNSARRLKRVLVFEREVMKKRVLRFTNSIPNRRVPVPADTLSMSMLPARSFFFSNYHRPLRVADLRGVSEWVAGPIETAQHILKLVWPEEAAQFRFVWDHPASDEPDAYLYRTGYWLERFGLQSTCKVTVAVMAPWALALSDLQDFIAVGKFPSFFVVRDQNEHKHTLSVDPVFQRVHKVWAKLWDDCSRKRCPYFILSVYNTWIFGVFTHSWTMAIVSEPIKFSTEKPEASVLQWLVFWLATSIDLPGTYKPPNLSRFGNPDIRDKEHVDHSLSIEFTGGPLMTHTQWLEKNHVQNNKGENVKTDVVLGFRNTFFTTFV